VPTTGDIDAALTRLAREESGRVLALLARRFRDLDLADEAVQDALATAARRWPVDGIPTNPPAWLFTVARNRAIDRLRRAATARRQTLAAAPDLIRPDDGTTTPDPSGADAMISEPDDHPVADDQLRLMLLCCHPALDRDAQVALTLRLVGGLTTAEIAAGLLVHEATLAQRIVRAKRKIRDAGIALTIPVDLAERVDVVLGVLYLIFNEGYLSRSTDTVVRIDLVDEAIRLTTALADILDDQPEVLGLLALERFHRARSTTRTDHAGDLILLEDQDRTRWDRHEIAEASALLVRAMRRMQPGHYQLQAVIARYHAVATTAADTDWPAIAGAYRQLVAMTDSPVVRLNHAVAVAMADGPNAGLASLEQVDGLDRYHLFHSTRGELLHRAGRHDEAAAAFATAITLTANDVERRHLSRRRDAARRAQT
jgi:RNA polymerase sigma-70 factor (ECF subfamily)